jgi:hypothetical protein
MIETWVTIVRLIPKGQWIRFCFRLQILSFVRKNRMDSVLMYVTPVLLLRFEYRLHMLGFFLNDKMHPII